MAEQYERLKDIGSYGLTCSLGFAFLKAPLGDGFRKSALIGSVLGTRSWKLIYKVLPDAPNGGFLTNTGEIQSRAVYLWDLFYSCKAGGDLPLIITCPRDGKDYLAVFEDDVLSYEMFSHRLFSTGLNLSQYRAQEINTLEDGSLGASDNPDRI